MVAPRAESGSRSDGESISPSPQLKAEQESPRAEVVFILVDHSAEMYKLDRQVILEVLQESDILLIESVEQNETNRRLGQDHANEITQSDLPIETLHKKLDDLFEGELIDDFSHLLFLDLAGSKIPVEYVDVNEDNPIYQQLDEASKNQEMMLNSHIRNFVDLARLQKQLMKYADLSARVIKYRDSLVQLQVSQAVRNPQNKGKKIAVMLGGFHTSPSIELSRQEDIDVTRIFPERVSEKKRDVVYRYVDEIERNIIFEKETANTPDLLNRALLERTYNYFIGDESISLEALRKAIERLSDEEIVTILGRVQSIGDGATEHFDDQKEIVREYLYESVLSQ